ncbi:MAG: ABC transporter permease [Candidatus Heimdallarchaeota archaeon]
MSLQTINFAMKNIFRKKAIAMISILGISIGIALMVVISSATISMDTMMNDTLASRVGDVEVTEHGKSSVLSVLPENITSIINTIDSKDKIKFMSPEIVVNGFTQYTSAFELPNIVNLFARGINLEKDILFEGPTSRIIEGDIFNDSLEIIVADLVRDIADEEYPGWLKIGTILPFQINETYFINLTLSGIYETDENPAALLLEPIFVMSIESARHINSLFLSEPYVGFSAVKIRFDTDNIEDTKAYAEELEELTPKMTVILLGYFGETVEDLLSVFNAFSTIISTIAGIAGGMAILVAQLMGVNERLKEFAIMKATGWKNRTIFFEIILESVMFGLIGSVLGIAFGIALIYSLEVSIGQRFIEITWQIILMVIGFGFGIGIVSGFLPGLKAARIKPMEVLRSS